jgi:very-short-patch-repair endonuclease
MLDFFCPAANLAVEIDGSAHDHPSRAERDCQRDEWLRQHGITVLHFPARQILQVEGRDDVLATIAAAASGLLPPPPPPPPSAVPLPRYAEEER